VSDPLLARTAKAIHTLFWADERAAARMAALEASVETDAELAALQALSVGLISFEPIPDDVLRYFQRLEGLEPPEPRSPSDRITIKAHESLEGDYVRRLLAHMYAKWQGTLDYERGCHRFSFFSPFDEQLRRHTSFAYVAVDGECPDLHARNYVLGPYLLAEDYRTKRKTDDPWKVLGGDLRPLLPEKPTRA
jgi:hypothetical protein